MKKLAIRIACALALVAFAAPALACGDKDKPQTAATDSKSSVKKDATAQKGPAADKGTKTATAPN